MTVFVRAPGVRRWIARRIGATLHEDIAAACLEASADQVAIYSTLFQLMGRRALAVIRTYEAHR
jgi:hypothetical protein